MGKLIEEDDYDDDEYNDDDFYDEDTDEDNDMDYDEDEEEYLSVPFSQIKVNTYKWKTP